jgi:hypothetical protein
VTQLQRVYYDDTGGIADSLRRVITDAAAWQQVWDGATSRRPTPPPIPSVDFENEMIILVAAGRMRVGSSIQVDSVGIRELSTAEGDTEDFLVVSVRTVEACSAFESDVYPLEIVRVTKFEGGVRYVESSEPGPGCGGQDDLDLTLGSRPTAALLSGWRVSVPYSSRTVRAATGP